MSVRQVKQVLRLPEFSRRDGAVRKFMHGRSVLPIFQLHGAAELAADVNPVNERS
jgi:hypothetical protein